MNIIKKLLACTSLVIIFGVTASCTKHEVDVKPIHITIDINVKVDRALDDFFGDLDKARTE